jgi:hypothetical protein
MTEGNTALGEIVGGQLHSHLVTCKDSNTIAAKAAGQVGQDDPVMLQLDAKQPTGKFFKYGSGYFDAVFFTQLFSLLLFSPIRQPAVATETAG